jgi:hypothetical protein
MFEGLGGTPPPGFGPSLPAPFEALLQRYQGSMAILAHCLGSVLRREELSGRTEVALANSIRQHAALGCSGRISYMACPCTLYNSSPHCHSHHAQRCALLCQPHVIAVQACQLFDNLSLL